MSKFKNVMKWLFSHMWVVGGILLLILGVILKSNSLKSSARQNISSAKKSVKESKEVLQKAKKVHEKISSETDVILDDAKESIESREKEASPMIRKKG